VSVKAQAWTPLADGPCPSESVAGEWCIRTLDMPGPGPRGSHYEFVVTDRRGAVTFQGDFHYVAAPAEGVNKAGGE
jgi:hypothetical protein